MRTIDGNSLEGVSATTLWTLHNRANEAKRPGSYLYDRWAVTLYESIRYDYLKFGRPNQSHAVRALAFDMATREYLAKHPRATVVALAEGLQTSFWRIDNPDITWLSIDLPPVMALRNELLPKEDRVVQLAQSALDRSWLDRVDPADGVMITAEGLLMYLEPDDARSLIADCAKSFPGGRLMFDSIPHWLSQRNLKGWKLSPRYTTPPMPFALSRNEALAIADSDPNIVAAQDVPWPPGRGIWKVAGWPGWDRVGFIRRNRPSITILDFG